MSENEKEDFYKLYGAFLELDERFALISGRARDIINQFYCWYNGLDLFDSAHKDMLLNEILGYAEKCEYTPQNLQQHIRGTTITPQDKKALDKARTLNQEAYKVYEKWRIEYGSIGNDMARLDSFNRYRLLAEKIIKTIKK